MKLKFNNIESFLFIAAVGVSLFLGYSVALIAACIPFVLFNRDYVLPTLLLIPTIEGGFTDDFPIPTETLSLIFLAPIIGFDLFRKGLKAERRMVHFFLGYAGLVVFGTLIALSNIYGDIPAANIVVNNITNLAQIAFFFLIYAFFVQRGVAGIRSSLEIMKNIIVPFLFIMFLYMNFKGVTQGFQEYLNFGDSRHGTFTASLVGISAYAMLMLFQPGSKAMFRVAAAVSLLMVLWIILNSGSRNGLFSFLLMGFLFYSVYVGLKLNLRNLGFLLGFVAGVGLFIFFNQDNPVFRRLAGLGGETTDLEEVSSGRNELWTGGVLGFLERPITGQGGDPSLTRRYSRDHSGHDSVIHNTTIEMAIQYGLIGLLVYFLMQRRVWLNYRSIRKRIKAGSLQDYGLFLVPFLAYFSLVFSSLFVSWLWSSLLWYHICLTGAIGSLHRFWLEERNSLAHAA